MLNHVLMHQTVIGLEAIEQMEEADAYPDVVIGCAGGGSNFAGIAFPFIGKALREKKSVRAIAVEPAACPSLTRGKYAFDFGDTGHLTPLVKMHTLGSEFIPPGFHAGGLRYHGMAPLVSHLKELGLIEARAYHQNPCFEAGVMFARHEGIVPAPETTHAIRAAIDEALKARGRGQVADDPVQSQRPRAFRHAGLQRLFRRQARGSGLRSKSARGLSGAFAEGGGGVRPAPVLVGPGRRPGLGATGCPQGRSSIDELRTALYSAPHPVAKSHSERQTQRFAGFLNARGSK